MMLDILLLAPAELAPRRGIEQFNLHLFCVPSSNVEFTFPSNLQVHHGTIALG